MMRIASAMLPDAGASQDRIFTTPSAVVVLDGASAFVPVEVSPSTYVDTLGRFLVEGLVAEPRISLTDLLAQAIEESALLLDLRPGSSPSSTVTIARQDGDILDLLVLGDSQIATPHGIYVDDRISRFALQQRAEYRARLADGHGYDETHRELLRALQAEQARHRNVEGGYWIAEAAPEASAHALVATLSVSETPWLTLATDGAYRPLKHMGHENWAKTAAQDEPSLQNLLFAMERWEALVDPDGIACPRAKRHDDKAIAAITVLDAAP